MTRRAIHVDLLAVGQHLADDQTGPQEIVAIERRVKVTYRTSQGVEGHVHFTDEDDVIVDNEPS